MWSLQVDESTDINGKAQLGIYTFHLRLTWTQCLGWIYCDGASAMFGNKLEFAAIIKSAKPTKIPDEEFAELRSSSILKSKQQPGEFWCSLLKNFQYWQTETESDSFVDFISK